jgi:hypothetical protein
MSKSIIPHTQEIGVDYFGQKWYNKKNGGERQMATLIGHYCDESGTYSTFTVTRLRETANLYVRTDETLSDAPVPCDNWEALNKCHLGRLRPVGDNIFTMYCLSEDLPGFEEKVSAALSFRQNTKILTF